MACSHLLKSNLWNPSRRHTEPINHLLDTFEGHIWIFEIGVKCQLQFSHTATCAAALSYFDFRYFLWVWSPCPTTTGSTRWTRGCVMGWASYPWQPRPCYGRKGSCQRPRAAATAQHQTGAQGSSHPVPCAGVCVCVCELWRLLLCHWGWSTSPLCGCLVHVTHLTDCDVSARVFPAARLFR